MDQVWVVLEDVYGTTSRTIFKTEKEAQSYMDEVSEFNFRDMAMCQCPVVEARTVDFY